MPLSTNEKTNEVATATIKQLQTVFGQHSGYRPAHAKGLLVAGSWFPTEDARQLSKAQHFSNATTLTIRLSSSTGIPQLPDSDPNGNPRGLAVRFNLGDRKHTDIIAHSTPLFPVKTGPDFLALFQAIAAGSVPDFLKSHPAAAAFLQAPKPFPKSFATEAYYGLSAFKLINSDGKETFIRYRFVPDEGIETYGDGEVEGKSPDFLREELQQRLASGSASFGLIAQIAQDGDVTDDITIQWPEDRKQVKLGTVKLEKVIEDSDELQRTTIFDPVSRIDGIEPSDDPLLDFRAAVYLISGRERRAAGGYDPSKLPQVDAVSQEAQKVT